MIYIVLVLLAFLYTEIIGQIVHRLAHRKSSNSLYDAHKTHHDVLYPLDNFKTNKYLDAGEDSLVYWFIYPFIATLVFFYAILSFKLFIIFTIVLSFTAFINNYIHDQIHLKNSRLKKYKFFKKLTKLHYIHHRYLDKNFGIIFFGIDRVLRSYRSKL